MENNGGIGVIFGIFLNMEFFVMGVIFIFEFFFVLFFDEFVKFIVGGCGRFEILLIFGLRICFVGLYGIVFSLVLILMFFFFWFRIEFVFEFLFSVLENDGLENFIGGGWGRFVMKVIFFLDELFGVWVLCCLILKVLGESVEGCGSVFGFVVVVMKFWKVILLNLLLIFIGGGLFCENMLGGLSEYESVGMFMFNCVFVVFIVFGFLVIKYFLIFILYGLVILIWDFCNWGLNMKVFCFWVVCLVFNCFMEFFVKLFWNVCFCGLNVIVLFLEIVGFGGFFFCIFFVFLIWNFCCWGLNGIVLLFEIWVVVFGVFFWIVFVFLIWNFCFLGLNI